MGNSRSNFSQSFSSTFKTNVFRNRLSDGRDNGNGIGGEEGSNENSNNNVNSSREKRRSPRQKSNKLKNNRRRSVSVDVRGRRRFDSAIHENLVKINFVRNVRDVYAGVDSTNNQVGEGTWGQVKLVRRRSNPQAKAAVKILKLSRDIKSSRMKELRTEISLLQQIDHPSIAKLYETYEEEGSNLYLVMEFLAGGELFDRVISLGNFRENKAADAVKQMVGAVQYLHAKGIIHRDLKLENFMYRSKSSDKLVLIDFGLSTRFGHMDSASKGRMSKLGKKKFLNEMVGSSYYMAPEVMKRKYGRECDLWSLGVIAYMLLSGHPPFAGDTDDEIMRRVRKGKYDFEHSAFNKVSPKSIDFVKGLLQYEPKSRMTAQEALQHQWLSDHHKKLIQRRSQRRGSMVDFAVVENLKSFVETNRFKKLALQAVAYSTRYEDIAHLQQLFEEIDQDQDGYITLEEFQKAMKDNPSVDPRIVEKIFTAMDVDKTQKVHLNAFIAATMNQSLKDDERILREAFRKLDINENGEITKDDLLDLLGKNFTPIQVDRMMAEFSKGDKTSSNRNHQTMTMEGFINSMRRGREQETESLLNKTASEFGDDLLKDDETDLSDAGDVPI